MSQVCGSELRYFVSRAPPHSFHLRAPYRHRPHRIAHKRNGKGVKRLCGCLGNIETHRLVEPYRFPSPFALHITPLFAFVFPVLPPLRFLSLRRVRSCSYTPTHPHPHFLLTNFGSYLRGIVFENKGYIYIRIPLRNFDERVTLIYLRTSFHYKHQPTSQLLAIQT